MRYLLELLTLMKKVREFKSVTSETIVTSANNISAPGIHVAWLTDGSTDVMYLIHPETFDEIVREHAALGAALKGAQAIRDKGHRKGRSGIILKQTA